MTRRLRGAAVAALLLTCPRLAAQDCRVTDLTPDFWRFWEDARGKPADEQVRLFESWLLKPHAAVYESAFRRAPLPIERIVREGIAAAQPHEAGMRRVSGELGEQLPALLQRFRASFADFRCPTPVYFMFSAGAFDGAVRELAGESALLFGIDVIARLQNDLGPLVVHELFHVHHDRVAPDGPDTIAWGLWREGLASYVSRRLHADLPEDKACCLPPAAPIEAALPKILPELRRALDSGEQATYARFFLGGREQDIPSRSGYYVGYRVAAELGRSRSLQQLAVLKPAELRPLLDAALDSLTPRPGGP